MGCWWPCCHSAIYRIDGDTGDVVWSADSGSNIQFTYDPTYQFIYLAGAFRVVSDADSIYVAQNRSTFTGDVQDAFTVQCLSYDGGVKWTADTGGNTNSLCLVPGVGLVVVHCPSHYVDDHLTLVTPPGPLGFVTIRDESLSGVSGDSISVARTDGSASVLSAMTSASKSRFSSSNTTVTGASFQSGLTFKFDGTLAGPTGLRPVVSAYGSVPSSYSLGRWNWNPNCASFANVTVLDINDGSIISRHNTFSSQQIFRGDSSGLYTVLGSKPIYLGGAVYLNTIKNGANGNSVSTVSLPGGSVGSYSVSNANNTFSTEDGVSYSGSLYNSSKKYSASLIEDTSFTGPMGAYGYDPVLGGVWSATGVLDPSTGATLYSTSPFTATDTVSQSDDGYLIPSGGVRRRGFLVFNKYLRSSVTSPTRPIPVQWSLNKSNYPVTKDGVVISSGLPVWFDSCSLGHDFCVCGYRDIQDTVTK